MDEETKLLYKLAKDFQDGLNNIMKEQLIGVGPFVKKYNEIRSFVIKKFPEAGDYTHKLTEYEGSYRTDIEIRNFSYVKLETNSLLAFLESKLDKSEEIIKDVLGVLNSKLRTTFREPPKKEREVQDNVDIVLSISNFNYLREKVTIPYSNKSFIPDFTFENEQTCLEIKFCNRETKEKELIDEINADIQAYKTRYQKLIFLVYDLGLIRDVSKFKQDINNDKDIFVEIIKH